MANGAGDQGTRKTGVDPDNASAIRAGSMEFPAQPVQYRPRVVSPMSFDDQDSPESHPAQQNVQDIPHDRSEDFFPKGRC